jgi:hypothetical protein
MTDMATLMLDFRAMPSKRIARDAVLLLVLVTTHEALKRLLADGAIVSALFSPGGAHSVMTLIVGLVLVVIRLILFVGVPGVLGAMAVTQVHRAVRRSLRNPRSRRVAIDG